MILSLLIKNGARENRWNDPIWLQKRGTKAHGWAQKERKILQKKHEHLLNTTREAIEVQRVVMADALSLCKKIDDAATHAKETAERARFGLGNVG